MKIAMTSVPFLPQVGGMETVVTLLARELVKLGCEVKVATNTPASAKDELPYQVIRQPSHMELWRLYRWADGYLQHGPSLKYGWPALLGSKPSFIVHHIWMTKNSGVPVLGRWLRLALLKRCQNFAVSEVLGQSLPVPCKTIPNPYDDERFRLMPEEPRELDLIFVGRLISGKGLDVLLDALAILKQKGLKPGLAVVGDGPARQDLERRAARDNLAVQFTGQLGPKDGDRLPQLLNRHKIMAVPTRWNEPFGLVALEGIACGCAVIGSSGGGLPEAIGPCGVTFPNGDAVALAEKIEILLCQPEKLLAFKKDATSHLACHRPIAVAQEYIELLRLDSPRLK